MTFSRKGDKRLRSGGGVPDDFRSLAETEL
jgi:hypothetical protein